jgi:phosphoribosylaminoimidazolecarboxamide formyltransferase/IMP cyclohydrolase
MLRSAAKNFQAVAVVTSPEQYGEVIEQIKKYDGGLDFQMRLKLAQAVFERTSAYDRHIAGYLKKVKPGIVD